MQPVRHVTAYRRGERVPRPEPRCDPLGTLRLAAKPSTLWGNRARKRKGGLPMQTIAVVGFNECAERYLPRGGGRERKVEQPPMDGRAAAAPGFEVN